jgi:hypothetical protein
MNKFKERNSNPMKTWEEEQKLIHGNNHKSKGLGDTIAKMTKAIGIQPCGGCKKRQAKLNEIFPYKK